MKQGRIGRLRDDGVLDRRVNQRDVAPPVAFNAIARTVEHLGALLNTDDSPLGSDLLAQKFQAEPGAARDIQDSLSATEPQAVDSTAANRFGELQFEVVDRCALAILT